MWNMTLKRGEQKNGIANYSEKFCWNGVQGWSRLLDKQHLINRALKLASYGNSSQGWLLGPFRCFFGCLPSHRVFVLLDALIKVARVAYIIGITWIAFNDVFGKLHIVRWSRIQWVEVFVNLRRLLTCTVSPPFSTLGFLTACQHTTPSGHRKTDFLSPNSIAKTETHLANCLNKC